MFLMLCILFYVFCNIHISHCGTNKGNILSYLILSHYSTHAVGFQLSFWSPCFPCAGCIFVWLLSTTKMRLTGEWTALNLGQKPRILSSFISLWPSVWPPSCALLFYCQESLHTAESVGELVHGADHHFCCVSRLLHSPAGEEKYFCSLTPNQILTAFTINAICCRVSHSSKLHYKNLLTCTGYTR